MTALDSFKSAIHGQRRRMADVYGRAPGGNRVTFGWEERTDIVRALWEGTPRDSAEADAMLAESTEVLAFR